MRKSSVLIRRADTTLSTLTAIAVTIAVAVGLSVFFIITGGQTSPAAQPGYERGAVPRGDARRTSLSGP